MGWRVTVGLAIAVAIALIGVWTDIRSTHTASSEWTLLGDPRGEAPGDQVKRLLDFDPTTITTIRLEKAGVTTQATRTDGKWTGAEPRLLDDFLSNLQEMAEIAPLEVEGELKDYGLEPPHGVIDLQRNDGPPIVVLIGQHNPPATGVYVQLGRDGPVVLTGALMQWEFDKAFKALTSDDATPAPVG